MSKNFFCFALFLALSACGASSKKSAPQDPQTQEEVSFTGRWKLIKKTCKAMDALPAKLEIDMANGLLAFIGTIEDSSEMTCRKAIGFFRNASSFVADTETKSEKGKLVAGQTRVRCVPKQGGAGSDSTGSRPSENIDYSMILDLKTRQAFVQVNGLSECKDLHLVLAPN
jgi:hypothetical protein